MNRLDDDLRRDLRVIADRATPSPDAWQQILNRAADQEPTQETEIIMLTDNTLHTRRWPLFAAAAAIAALAVGAIIALGTGGDDTEQPADTPTPTVPPAPETPEPDTAETDGTAPDTPMALPPETALVEPGRYTTDVLGVPFSLEVPDVASAPWRVVFNNREAIGVGYGNNNFVAIKRIGSFYDANEAQDPSLTGLGSIPPDGIDQWIDVNDIIVDASREMTVGGRTADFRQVRVPLGAGNALCADGLPPCINMVSSSADQQTFNRLPTMLFSELPHSFWMVELGEFEPLGIWAYTAEPDHQAWLDELAPLIESIELGEPGPAVEDGIARLPLRVDVFASYSGSRTVGPLLDDGTAAVTTEHVVEGDLVGELIGAGVQVTPRAGQPDASANGYDDLTFTGTIDGLGSGTLTMLVEWRGSPSGDIATTTTVTGGTGDFTGTRGQVIMTVDAPDASGDVPIWAGRMTLQLVVPQG